MNASATPYSGRIYPKYNPTPAAFTQTCPPSLHPHVWSPSPDMVQITWGAPVAAGCNLEVAVQKLKLLAHQRPFYEEQ